MDRLDLIDSRCGLLCTGCPWKESHGCGGCIETNGHPFHGECPIAQCCQNKGLAHCGECDIMPCEQLYDYSYNAEYGDKPQGTRVEICRKWAAESGKQAWTNVLLTDSGWHSSIEHFNDDTVKKNILRRFHEMLGKPAGQAKVLFIPTAANNYDKETSGLCLIHAYLSFHCPKGTEARTDMPLLHIPLTENQALEVRWNGYSLIEG